MGVGMTRGKGIKELRMDRKEGGHLSSTVTKRHRHASS